MAHRDQRFASITYMSCQQLIVVAVLLPFYVFPSQHGFGKIHFRRHLQLYHWGSTSGPHFSQKCDNYWEKMHINTGFESWRLSRFSFQSHGFCFMKRFLNTFCQNSILLRHRHRKIQSCQIRLIYCSVTSVTYKLSLRHRIIERKKAIFVCLKGHSTNFTHKFKLICLCCIQRGGAMQLRW